MESINLIRFESPLGAMVACAASKGICMLEFDDRKNFDKQIKSLKNILNSNIITEMETPLLAVLRTEMNEYFLGKRKLFSVPLHLAGTEFQKTVWNELLKIPLGQTLSYMQLAVAVANAKTVRAVANANAINKIAIVIPCHRVIGSNGSLTGYAGGLERKQWLLNLENNRKQLF